VAIRSWPCILLSRCRCAPPTMIVVELQGRHPQRLHNMRHCLVEHREESELGSLAAGAGAGQAKGGMGRREGQRCAQEGTHASPVLPCSGCLPAHLPLAGGQGAHLHPCNPSTRLLAHLPCW